MTTPTPEAIAASKEALKAWTLDWDGDDVAEAVIAAVQPIIAAQAKAEALREAADEFGSWGPTGIPAANALRARAATIEGESE